MPQKTIAFTVINDLVHDQRMHRICHSLHQMGFHVTLIGRVLPTSGPLPVLPYTCIRLQCFFNKGPLFYLEYNLRLIFKLLALRLDVIGSVDLDTLLAGTLVARIQRKPLVYDAHEYFSEVPEVVNRTWVKRLWEMVANWCIPYTALRYTVGPALAREMGERYKRPFHVIRNVPIPYRESLPNPRPEKPYILYQGALNKGRGLEELIRAMHNLPDVQLIIAGRGDLDQQLRDLVAREMLQNHVEFLGAFSAESIKPYTRNALVGYNVLALQGKSYYFSLANKFFDYTMAGVPCLVSKFPEYQNIHEQYCIGIYTNLDENSIVKNVRRLVDDPAWLAMQRQKCLEAKEELNWEKESGKLQELYKPYVG